MNVSWKIHVTGPSHGQTHWPVRVSVPLPKGERVDTKFSVQCPDGRVVPAQSRVLVSWPDGSPRWVQLDFQASQVGEHVVLNMPANAEPELPVRVEQEESTIHIAVGRLRMTLDLNSGSPVAAIAWNGRQVKPTTVSWRFTAVNEDGKVCPPAPALSRSFQVEAKGPHRCQVSWETQHVSSKGNRLLDMRFRVELLAGVEGFTLSYQFLHKLPGRDALKLNRISAVFPFDARTREKGRAVVVQSAYGNIGLRRFVRTRGEVRMRVDRTRFSTHVEDPAMLDDRFVYPHFLRGVNLDTGSAVALEDDQAAVICAMRDFECQRPKGLTVRPGEIEFGIWPEWAGPLTLPQGRSASQVFCFQFCDPDPDKVDALLANPKACTLEPAVCWLDKADSIHAGPTWDQPRLFDGSEPGAAFFSHLLQTATGRWETVPEMFHYGDTVDTGYTAAYPSTGRTPAVDPQFSFAAGSHVAHAHFHTSDHLAPVWSNNEYDAIYCLALEAIRTRDAAALHRLRAAARHQIEVDFVHYSDHWQQHRSTPQHSYDHVSLMASIPSHQWTQGLYYYYALTGDDDVPEVVRAICDFDLAFLERDEVSFGLYFNRELGWALVALVFGYELTAETKYLEMSRKIIRKLQKDASRTDFSDVQKVCSSSVGLNATGIGTGFNVNTIPLGLKVYHQATGETWALELLREWVDFGMTNHNNKATGVKITELFPETFCYVSEIAGEKRYLEESLWQLLLFFRGFDSIGWLDEMGRPLTTKQYTRVYRGLVHYLSALAKAGMLPRVEKQLLGEA